MKNQIVLLVFGCITVLLGLSITLYATLTDPFSVSTIEGPFWNLKVSTFITLSGKLFIGGLGSAGFGAIIATTALFSLSKNRSHQEVSSTPKTQARIT